MDVQYAPEQECIINRPIEPGLIEGFRFYYVLRTIIGMTIFTVFALLGRFELAFLFGIANGLVMLIYLRVGYFRQFMGNYYLPIALTIAVIETLAVEKIFRYSLIDPVWAANAANFTSPMDSIAPFISTIELEVWRVFPPLFFLLIFVSWQYSMREVGLFVLVTALSELILPVDLGLTMKSQVIVIMMIIFVRSMAFMVIGFLITQLIAAQRQQRYELSIAQAKLTNYATMVESLSISRERNRMARELHDTLAHTLSAASVQLEAVNSLWDADSGKAHSQLQRALTTTRNGLQETRRALQSLRASPLEELGLVLALRELGEATERRCGTDVTMVMPEKVENIPAEVEQTMYRVAQEALENITRHACAKTAQISLVCSESALQLDVEDDGIGFDVDKLAMENGHYGLRGMKERVDALGGEIRISSQPQHGTQVRVVMGV